MASLARTSSTWTSRASFRYGCVTAAFTRSHSKKLESSPARVARCARTSPRSMPTSPRVGSGRSTTGRSPSFVPRRARRFFRAWSTTRPSRCVPSRTTLGPSPSCESSAARAEHAGRKRRSRCPAGCHRRHKDPALRGHLPSAKPPRLFSPGCCIEEEPGPLGTECTRTSEDGIEHRLTELARERVLLTWMVGAQQGFGVETVLGQVGKAWPWPDPGCPGDGITGKPAQANDDPCRREELELPLQVGKAAIPFLRTGAVCWWRASDCGRDPRSGQHHPVVSSQALRLARIPSSPERSEEPVPG